MLKLQEPFIPPAPSSPQTGNWFFAAVVFGAAALRAVYVETPVYNRIEPALPNTSEAISLAITSVLFLSLMGWIIRRSIRPSADRIRSGLASAAVIFTVIAFAAVLIASDKRAAINDATFLCVPILLAAAFVEIFRDFTKLCIFLSILTALGVMTVFLEYEQASEDNQMMIQNYEEHPEQFLEQLGIEPGSLQQWQFEHRLYSKDIKGFLRTSNSTGSFLLLCLFGSLGLGAQRIKHVRQADNRVMLALHAILSIILLAGIILCRSRGAIGACVIGLAGFVITTAFGRTIWKLRRAILLAFLLGGLLVAGLVISYGLKHGRLPGPNAMFVRWQYWVSTAQMIADHPLLGVGGGNFSDWYTHYKIPAAPETVKDPHNIMLAILSQYGILGFAALAAVVILPIRTLLRKQEPPATTVEVGRPLRPGLMILLLILPVLVFLRLFISEGHITETDPGKRLAYFFIMYIVPAAVFTIILGTVLVITSRTKSPPLPAAPLAGGIAWGLIAVLIHNLIDFAIFESVVWTTFWLMLAALISLTLEPQPNRLPVWRRRLYIGLPAAVAVIYFALVFLPPWKAGLQIQQSLQGYQHANAHLTAAAQLDRLAYQPLYYRGQAAAEQFYRQPEDGTNLLVQAAADLANAARRNRAAFYIPKAQMKTFMMLYQYTPDEKQQTEYLEQAYSAGKKAYEKYPGSDELAFTLGQIAEKLERPDEALAWYRTAVKIERDYRIQFAVMYPEYDLYSRLGEKRFEYARGYIMEHSPTD